MTRAHLRHIEIVFQRIGAYYAYGLYQKQPKDEIFSDRFHRIIEHRGDEFTHCIKT